MNSKLLMELLNSRIEERNLSLREAAVEIGVSHTTIARVRNGESAGDIDTLVAICEWLNISPSRLLDTYADETKVDSAIVLISQFYPEFKDVLVEAASRIERHELDPSFMKELIGYMKYRISLG